MKTTLILIKRNVKLFFKDKGMFFTSLATPLILLVLYATFLSKMYRDNFTASVPEGVVIAQSVIDGLVGGQLISSLLSVTCVTVAFCSNFLMVQDKALGVIKDLKITPVKSAKLSISYYVATLACTLIVCLSATAVSFIYLAIVGWYLSLADALLLVLDVIILSLFGTAISSIINYFLSSQGQISAVGSIVSAGYGFICGAYMPISAFSEGLQKVVSFLPGTYGTALFRNHALNGALDKMLADGAPQEVIDGIAKSLDCSIEFFGNKVSQPIMYLIVVGATVLLLGGYILLNALNKKKSK